VDGHAVISHEVLASYAADAALEVEGVHELVEGARRHKGARVSEEDGATSVELHVALEWGASGRDVGSAVQGRVAEYLDHMARLPSVTVDVVVAGVATSSD
jgi:uncharacterized alkaline shock family protein YloU